MTKQELIKLLKWLPCKTKIYDINGREATLAGGITLDVHCCVDEYGNSIFRQLNASEIRDVSELLYCIGGSNYIRECTPPSIINSYIGKITDLPIPEKALIFWQWGQTMNKDELQKAMELARKMRREDEKMTREKAELEKNLLNDSDDVEVLEQQIDILERALQSNKSEMEYLGWRLGQIGGGKQDDIWDLEKEVQSKKSSREWEIIKLERKINEKQRKINFLKKKKISLLSMVRSEEFEKIKKENNNLYQQLLNAKKKLLKLLRNGADSRLETDSQKSFLDMLLKVREQLTFLENSPQSLRMSSERQLEKAKKVLSEKLTNEEIINFCQLQKEITDLEIKLESLQETQIEINEL